MDVIDLDGNTQKWSLTGYIAKGSLGNKSSLHINARALIKKLFPTFQILEEVPIPLRKSETLYLDFYLPLSRICIEVHGQQHYEFSAFFHGNKMNFLKHQKRDRDKKEWCSLNGIKLLELPYDEQDHWEEILTHE